MNLGTIFWALNKNGKYHENIGYRIVRIFGVSAYDNVTITSVLIARYILIFYKPVKK